MGTLPSVAHLLGTYLGFTETFLHDEFRRYRRYEPWIYATTARHLDRFPSDRLTLPPSGAAPRLWAEVVSAHYTPWFLPLMRARGTVVVHARFGPFAVGALPFVWFERWPLVASFYGYDVGYLREPWRHPGYVRYLLLARTMFGRASRLLVLSEAMRRDLAALGAPAHRIEIVRNGVDTDRFRPAAEEVPGPPAVLLCGREVEKKGFAFGLEALARLQRRGVPFRILLHGTPDGPMRPALLRRVRELGLGDRFEDVAPRTPTAEVMRRAALILAPSVTAADGDREGVPTVLVEASASGLPAVASRHAGIPEIVDDGRTGLLCAERDVAGLAEGLGRLLEDRTLRRRMGEAARQRAVEGWDAERMAERREAIYDAVR